MVAIHDRQIEGFSLPHLQQHPFRSSQGNAVVLMLVDSRGNISDTSIVDETMLVAMQHFGFPCRIHDFASGPLSPEELSNSAVIVIAQERLGASLSNTEIEDLATTIRDNGLGLVNFDGELNLYPQSFRDLIGLEIDPIPFASDLLVFTSCDHYITSTQQAGKSLRLNRPAPFSQVKPLDDAKILAQATLGKDQMIFSRHNIPGTAYEPGEYPMIIVKAFGKGRIVQFTCSTRLWHREFLGHGMGMDGPFWRAIVWAARKPLIVKMMPPFITLRVDDAIGRMDFHYTDVFNQRGYHPLISCFINNVPPRIFPFMKQKYREQFVDWDAHALDYYHLIPYKFGIGEYSKPELDAIFTRIDQWYADMDILPPITAYCHWGEIGVNALPYFKERGRKFLNLTYSAGQVKWERLFPNWWPYGLDSLFYDYIPEDPELYTLGAVLPRHLMSPDVLTGSTLCMGENSCNDMNKAAERAALSVRRALDSGFFAEITTHEQKFSVLSLEEIDHWLTLLDQEISHYQPRLVGHELVAKYSRARDETWLSEVIITEKDRYQVAMIGDPNTALELAIFENDGDEISMHWVPVPDFKGEVKFTI
jgi:hypothetical protein